MTETTEYTFKTLIVGEINSGKTSIIKRYVHNIYSDNYRATIGVDFSIRGVYYPDKLVRIQLWDIAGQERFGNMTRVYYKEANGAVVVCDASRTDMLNPVLKWREDLDTKINNVNFPVVLMVNKIDIAHEMLDRINFDKVCKEYGFVGYFKTSAKKGINIEESFKMLSDEMLDNYEEVENDNWYAPIILSQKEIEQKKGCC